MSPDDFLYHDVGMFLQHIVCIESVLPLLKCSERNGTRRETNESRKITARGKDDPAMSPPEC